jgi:hypothetical protein
MALIEEQAGGFLVAMTGTARTMRRHWLRPTSGWL